jgi:hypothetical protein
MGDAARLSDHFYKIAFAEINDKYWENPRKNQSGKIREPVKYRKTYAESISVFLY